MSRVFSAPGKALVAGGYLVLDPEYDSYVTALSSRMHSRIELNSPLRDDHSMITVSSPQFDGFWAYKVFHKGEYYETETINGGKNLFLEETIKVVLAYVVPREMFNYRITLFSDPGFHTQDGTEQRSSANLKKLFLYHRTPIGQVPKTGMGLSAGLVSVVTSSLLAVFLNKPASNIIDIIHNISQIAHCGAQGKIGSGFDVAAAVYGSIIYKRFNPSVVEKLLDQQVSNNYCLTVQRIANSKWNFTHDNCSLPPGLRLIMGDVKGGSETPKLVAQVLEWQKRDDHSGEVYHNLESANSRFTTEMQRLNRFSDEKPIEYQKALIDGTLFMPLSNCISAIRVGLQLLTARSGADIEPPEQTQLLNKCEELPGCVGGVVPGAGGFDAICLLVDDSQVEKLKDITKTDESFAALTWLDLNEESQGIMEESEIDFQGL